MIFVNLVIQIIPQIILPNTKHFNYRSQADVLTVPIHIGLPQSTRYNAQCWFDVGPAWWTVAHHYINIESMFHICWNTHPRGRIRRCQFNVDQALCGVGTALNTWIAWCRMGNYKDGAYFNDTQFWHLGGNKYKQCGTGMTASQAPIEELPATGHVPRWNGIWKMNKAATHFNIFASWSINTGRPTSYNIIESDSTITYISIPLCSTGQRP